MRYIDKDEVEKSLNYGELVMALRSAFQGIQDCTIPLRHHYALEGSLGGTPPPALLLMPAWQAPSLAGYLGVKVCTVVPSNPSQGLPAVQGVYVLSRCATGEPLAAIHGAALTEWRTACTSALAADYLARKDARVMLMVGAGALAPHLIRSHLAVRPSLTDVIIWNRSPEKSAALAAAMQTALSLEAPKAGPGMSNLRFSSVCVTSSQDLEAAVRRADIISCATQSQEPLVLGEWLKDGVHLDLVGSYKPTMREVDDEAILRSGVFVDTREGALTEAGDLVGPIARGILSPDDVQGDLAQLVQGTRPGRQSQQGITLFKSVGFALEDLVAAQLVYEKGTDGITLS